MSAVEREIVEFETGAVGVDRTLRLVPLEQPELAYETWQRHLKRAVDIAVVLLLAPVVLIVGLVIGVALKITSPGPVLFKQERISRGRPFQMLKFRSMYVDATERLQADPVLYARYVECDFKLPADEDTRITPIGRFLRSSSLDELPQLFNVLRGDMSLVGPRPIEAAQVASYGSLTHVYLRARPGLTGRWQTAGRSNIVFPERAYLDAEYLENWSMWQDFVIMAKTVPAVLRRHGSH